MTTTRLTQLPGRQSVARKRAAGYAQINSAQLLVNVIAEIEGPELGKAMVRLAAEQEADPKKKQRPQAALQRFPEAAGPRF